MPVNVPMIRNDFPILRRTFKVFAHPAEVPPIYLDHGASTHPPLPVLESYSDFMRNHYANIHRGMHFLSQESSTVFDEVPEIITDFIGGSLEEDRVIMCSNTTDALELTAFLERETPGITLTTMLEHHSNDLPHRKYGKVVHAGLTPEGGLDMEDVELKFNENKVKLMAVTGASNVTGYMPPLKELARLAHDHGARILVDAAQLLAHHPIDVGSRSSPEHIDYLVAAGHKAYAPFGSSFLFAPIESLDGTSPRVPGGGTVRYVTTEDALWVDSPDRHQGGTPNIGGAVAFAASLRYLKTIGMEAVREHEVQLYERMQKGLDSIEGVTCFGPTDGPTKIGVLPFNVGDIPHTTVALMLNWEEAIACRNGCFCAHPYLHQLLTIANDEADTLRDELAAGNTPPLPGAVRATIGVFNNEEEIDIFVDTVRNISTGKVHGDYSDLTKLTHQIDFFRTGRARGVPFVSSDIESS